MDCPCLLPLCCSIDDGLTDDGCLHVANLFPECPYGMVWWMRGVVGGWWAVCHDGWMDGCGCIVLYWVKGYLACTEWLVGWLVVCLVVLYRTDRWTAGCLSASLPLSLSSRHACLPACPFPRLCANLTAMQRHDRRPGGRAIGRHRHYVLTTFLCAVVLMGLIISFPLSHTWVE